MRIGRGTLANLALVLLLTLSVAAPAGAAPITTFDAAFQFRWNVGANSVGVPTGDQQFVGIINVSPTAGTTVTATQGVATRPLPFTPATVFPTMFRSLDPFDAALTGSWSITASNGSNSAGPVLTNPIVNPQLVPLAQNLQVMGTGPTPTITWSLPDLTGFDVENTRIFVYDDATNDLFHSTFISGTPTQFTIPSGVLASGVPYIFAVLLEDGESYVGFPGSLENRSSAFTQSGYVVPEPTTVALLGGGLAGLGAWRSRRRTSEAR